MEIKNSGTVIKRIGLVFTAFGWIILVAMFGWVFGAVGWWLLVTLWRKELLIPSNVIATTYITFTVIIIAVIFFLFFLCWTKYNSRKYYQENKWSKGSMKKEAPYLTKDEALLIIQNEDFDTYFPDYKIVCKDYLLIKNDETFDPIKLLSRAKIYNEKKAYKEAASLLRIIISHPQIQSTVKLASLKELETALHNLGTLGREASHSYIQLRRD